MSKWIRIATRCAVVALIVAAGCNGIETATSLDVANETPDAGARDAAPDAARDAAPDAAVVTSKLGGSVSGLEGSGFVVSNGDEDLAIAAGATSFQFKKAVASGKTFAVSVKSQPSGPAQTCAVEGGSATMGDVDVTSVAITCTTNTYAVGGTLSGLIAAPADAGVDEDAGAPGVTLSNGTDEVVVSANGAFAFPQKVASGGSFEVAVKSQPGWPAQTCTVNGATGTVVAGDVSSVAVNCTTNTYTVGGQTSGLTGTLVLRIDDRESATVNSNGAFAFATPVASAAAYAVTVETQPAHQTCTVSKGAGFVHGADVADVVVVCETNLYAVRANVTGFGGGTPLVLQNNGADDLSIASDGTASFSTQLAPGSAYDVSLFAQPTSPWQTCTLGANASGTVGDEPVVVDVTCPTGGYFVAANVTGLPSGGTLVLQNNGGDDLSVTADGKATFVSPVTIGDGYDVTVFSAPVTHLCTAASPSGTLAAPGVTVDVTCIPRDCINLGAKRGNAPDWACPAGFRMPTTSDLALASACVTPADQATFGYYNDIAVSVGGCGCKWNSGYCGIPSIETISQGRTCGDYKQLHICLKQ